MESRPKRGHSALEGQGQEVSGKRGKPQPLVCPGPLVWVTRCGGHWPWWQPCRGHTRLYSFRFSCRMVSLTAAKTKRMFSVSVAHVKCE